MAAPCMTLKPAGLRTPFLASRPARATPRCLTAARASSSSSEAHVQATISKAVCWGTAAAALLAAGNASAAQEIAELAGADNRLGIIATLFLPVVGWVGYNIGGPALNQLANISDKRESSAKGAAKKLRMKMRGIVSALVGLSAASLLATPQADAASEAFQLAGGDNRLGIIATLFLPVVGWVGYNIAGPALNQLANITEKREGGVRGVRKAFGVKKRAAAAGIAGLSAASLLATPQADAATEAFQLAAGDNRLAIIATLFLPVVGWVLFNIGGPALNQLANITEKREGGARGVRKAFGIKKRK